MAFDLRRTLISWQHELARILDDLDAEAGSVPEGLSAEAEAFWRAS